ncbi:MULTISPECIES: hypothetical protein [Wolbachia]|uniref:hypothetical protein n=2 Tax=Wolbachieae TaxID=952 RepID=UPI00221FB204|nr:hypothetical protein [Wolbachia endosymbiont (group B) of Sphaerophoria taeniata]
MLILELFELENIMQQQASNREKGIKFMLNQCRQKCYVNKTKQTDQKCLDECREYHYPRVLKFCKLKCDSYTKKQTDPEFLDECRKECISKFYPQISEKLLASENNLYDESTELSLMADTLDAMFF